MYPSSAFVFLELPFSRWAHRWLWEHEQVSRSQWIPWRLVRQYAACRLRNRTRNDLLCLPLSFLIPFLIWRQSLQNPHDQTGRTPCSHSSGIPCISEGGSSPPNSVLAGARWIAWSVVSWWLSNVAISLRIGTTNRSESLIRSMCRQWGIAAIMCQRWRNCR